MSTSTNAPKIFRSKSIDNLRARLHSKIGQRKPDIAMPTEDLYRLELADPRSPIIPVNIGANKSKVPDRNLPSSVKDFFNSSTSTHVRGSSSVSSHQRTLSNNFPRRRTPTPPPPYTEECHQPLLPSDVRSDSTTDPRASIFSRQGTSSASSWVKNVISRSSSRSSLRQQYAEIPLSAEEIEEAERIKSEKARAAIAEWNRINKALKDAGF